MKPDPPRDARSPGGAAPLHAPSLLRRALLAVAVVFGALIALAAARILPLGVSPLHASLALCVDWALASAAVALAVSLRGRRAAQVLLVGSTLISLVLAEGALRLLHPAGAALALRYLFSPRYHHILPPGVRMVSRMVSENRLNVPIATNEDGLRTTYTRASFLAKRRRVVFLGDSFTFGLGVEGDAALPSVVERMLRQRTGSDEVAVLNTGAVGYSPILEKLVLGGVASEYRPELVVLVLDATDFGDDIVYGKIAQRHGDEISFAAKDVPLPDGLSVLHHLALYERLYLAGHQATDLILHPLSGGMRARGPGLSALPAGYKSKFFIFQRPPEETRPYFEATLQHVRDAAASARRMGAAFVLVVAPRYQLWDPDACPRNWEAKSYGNHDPYTGEYLRFFAEARGRVDFPILDVSPAFLAHKTERLVFQSDPHWTERGNEVAAQAITDFILDRGLLR